MAGRPPRKTNPEYFAFSSPILVVAITVGFYFLSLVVFCPENVPSILGSFGSFLKYLGREYHTECLYLLVISIGVHVLESYYGYTLCRKYKLSSGSTTKWMVQTMLFGYASLRELKKYNQSLKRLE